MSGNSIGKLDLSRHNGLVLVRFGLSKDLAASQNVSGIPVRPELVVWPKRNLRVCLH
jgi:hypothetical protein